MLCHRLRTRSLHLESFGMSSSETSQNLPIQPSPENSAGEQPVSQRRIEANRRTALRSTGPKRAQGKDMAARNSWKHGLLAKSAVIMLGPAKENKAEFEELLSGLRDYFAPVGEAVQTRSCVHALQAGIPCFGERHQSSSAQYPAVLPATPCRPTEAFIVDAPVLLGHAITRFSGNSGTSCAI
jgi:hypothetical protein